MKSLLSHPFSVAVAIGLTAACAPGQFTTATIYDSPAAFVRLEVDRTVETGREHSHPVSIPPAQIAAVLAGIMIEEPLAKLPFYDDTSQPRRHRVFTEKEVVFFAPLLASALGQATPEEIVTFYESRDVSGTVREVTSGGIFIQGEILRIRLANYRSHTHQSADIGVVDTQDDRLTPLRSLAPQRGLLHFEPRSSMAPDPVKELSGIFSWDHREVAVRYRSLPPHPMTPEQPNPSLRP